AKVWPRPPISSGGDGWTVLAACPASIYLRVIETPVIEHLDELRDRVTEPDREANGDDYAHQKRHVAGPNSGDGQQPDPLSSEDALDDHRSADQAAKCEARQRHYRTGDGSERVAQA